MATPTEGPLLDGSLLPQSWTNELFMFAPLGHAQLLPEADSAKSASGEGESVSRRSGKQLWSAARDSVQHYLKESAGKAFIEASRLEQIRSLGEGAFAKVDLCTLKGQDGQPGREVAVKRLKPELFHNETDLEDFVREGVLLNTLDHPSIVKVYGLGFDAAGQNVCQESAFICTEACMGGSLRALVRQQMMAITKVIYTYADAQRWSLQIACGLAYLHDHKPMIIHRDIKLDNVLLAGDRKCWDAKLTDFGLHAKVAAKDSSEKSAHLAEMAKNPDALRRASMTAGLGEDPDAILTQSMSHKPSVLQRLKSKISRGDGGMYNLTGLRMSLIIPLQNGIAQKLAEFACCSQTGSFLNMAPECVLKRPYNEKCDIFALGVCIFELFSKTIMAADVTYTGAPEEFFIFASRVARGYRRPHPKHWGTALSTLVTDCMKQDPRDRLTAAQVVNRLKELGDSGSIAAMDQHSSRCCVVQ